MQSGGIEHVGDLSIGASARPALSPACGVWGVLNVTPDSFSDGGLHFDPRAALAQARAMIEQGASVIDIGGASSRPAGALYGSGAAVLSAHEELKRVAKIVAAVRSLGATVSIDTTQPEVARGALALGATIVNDVSCAASEALLAVTAEANAEYVVMHSRGRGEVAPHNTRYGDLCAEVQAELMQGIERARAAGIARERIWIDPGIGFAKTAAQSLALLGNLEQLVELGYPVLVGASRKGFIAEVAPRADGHKPEPSEREAGGLAALTVAVLKGARAVRVHRVAEARQAVLVAEALMGARTRDGAGEC